MTNGGAATGGHANALYYGDNLDVLRNHIRDESVDLVYLDPPFNSNANYNVLFKAPSGDQSAAQIEAFEDTWHWGNEAESAFLAVLRNPRYPDVGTMLQAMRQFLRENDMMAYLTMMAVRLIELHRVLKPTGSLYLHCDPTASHYLKILLDAVFGRDRYQNEIVWKRTGAHGGSNRWGPIHDIILFYAKSEGCNWNRTFQAYDPSYIAQAYNLKDDRGRYQLVSLSGAGTRTGDSGKPWRGINPTDIGRHWAVPIRALSVACPGQDLSVLTTQEKLDLLDAAGLVAWPERGSVPRQKRYSDENPGVPVQDIITDIGPLSSRSDERLGYQTQKPVALLERIISASSNQGDIVLDAFCGCGTAIHAAEKLGRRWIGIDITHLAISLIERRLRDAFPDVAFDVHGTPKDIGGARDLAARDKYQFQWWAVSLVDAVPYGGKKKGPDGGIDGWRYMAAGRNAVARCIISVKGGENVSVQMMRELRGIIEREKAEAGLLITLAEPTRQMTEEAAKAGRFDSPFGAKQHPRLQVMTIEALLNGTKPDLPPLAIDAAFNRAEREDRAGQAQGVLPDLGLPMATRAGKPSRAVQAALKETGNEGSPRGRPS